MDYKNPALAIAAVDTVALAALVYHYKQSVTSLDERLKVVENKCETLSHNNKTLIKNMNVMINYIKSKNGSTFPSSCVESIPEEILSVMEDHEKRIRHLEIDSNFKKKKMLHNKETKDDEGIDEVTQVFNMMSEG